jgi:signal transduction histidine kinase
LHNLVDNALKFAGQAPNDANGPRETSQPHETGRARGEAIVEGSAMRDGQHAVLSVRDNGPGVNPKLLPNLFEPFRRGEDEFTRETQGTGLGLAIVKQLVSQLDGQVVARNAEEMPGFVVNITLPIRDEWGETHRLV